MHQETFEKCMLIRARKRDNRKTYSAGGTSGTIPPILAKIINKAVSLIEVKVAVAVH